MASGRDSGSARVLTWRNVDGPGIFMCDGAGDGASGDVGWISSIASISRTRSGGGGDMGTLVGGTSGAAAWFVTCVVLVVGSDGGVGVLKGEGGGLGGAGDGSFVPSKLWEALPVEDGVGDRDCPTPEDEPS